MCGHLDVVKRSRTFKCKPSPLYKTSVAGAARGNEGPKTGLIDIDPSPQLGAYLYGRMGRTVSVVGRPGKSAGTPRGYSPRN
jgi:hypothetical protein